MTFTLRFLDPDDWPIEYKAFCIFEEKLCIWDSGPNAGDGQVLHTADGVTWSTLFSRTPAQIGTSADFSGLGMAVYNGNLFITEYRSTITPPCPRVIEWDGSNVINHLESPLYQNYMASNLVVWDGKLWCLTDVTPYIFQDKRVVYYYDGTSWTPVTNYDGADYLDYERETDLPEYEIKHRTTRLFVFNDELYLIATRSPYTRWAWEVWKFDAAGGAHFTKLFDSDVFNDGCVLAAIMEFEGKVYIVGNLLDAHGNAGVIGTLYSSPDMENWTEEISPLVFEDEFNDASRDPLWTDQANNGTITEAGDVLTLAIANGINGGWYATYHNAPVCWISPEALDATIITKLNPYTVNNETRAGIYITDAIDVAKGIHFCRVRNDGAGQDGLAVYKMAVGTQAYIGITTLPIWLRVTVTGATMVFDYSTNGTDWTNLHTMTDEPRGMVGLLAWNWGGFRAISAPFEFFHLSATKGYRLTGFPYGETLHEGKFYLNCVNVLPHNRYTWIRRWEGRLGEFILDQEIATNPISAGGGLAVFKDGIYAGKYKEVYGEPGTVYRRAGTRLKRDSMPLMEMGYKDMHGNKYTERLAPIDTRAPDRFYHGRIKQMSSLKRAVDDKTGLFQIADMSLTLANADKHYSQLLASHILKNQEATLYHAWTEEAEVLRLEVIKLIIEDHSMKGPDFMIKLKDITQKYFTMKVPQRICTKEGVDGVGAFPDIHPDYEGWCMPEILGNASLLGGDYEYEGAVQAVYIDTEGPPFRCLASAGLITIPADEVWIGTAQKTEGALADYTVVQPGDGHTYIHFNEGQDPGTESVSFNAHGYSLAAWNSPAGYIQNLAYIIQYYLRYIMSVPASLVNSPSFATLAGYYKVMGVHLDSYLILQNREDAMETLRQLLFTGGAKGFMALDGKFNVARKNIYNWQVPEIERHIFEQIELFGSPHRKWNLTSAINTVNAQFGYIPWQNLYTGARSEYKDNRYERPMEGNIPDRWMGRPRKR